MSHSPTASLSNSSESVPKKRKTMGSGDLSMAASSQQQPHIPKRGARACTSCRKGKNRCEGEVRPVFLIHFHSQRPVITVPRPGSFNRLLVVGARPAVLLAFSKSQRKKMYKDCPQRVSSMFFLCNIIIFTSHLFVVGVYPGLRASTWYC